MKNNKLVSIITINYNQSVVTNKLLVCLGMLNWDNFEVLLIDNASNEYDFRNLDTNYPFLRVIRSESNLGFAGGNNIGIKAAKGEYLLFLNNDTIVESSFLEPLVQRLESHDNIGAVSPKIKYYENPERIQYAGYSPMNNITLQMHAIGYQQKDRGQYDQARETSFAHGCAMMLKREVLHKTGYMPEVYFLYYEELDWCNTIKKAGYTIWYEPGSTVYHKESLTVIKKSPLKTYFQNRNRILFMRRNTKGFFRLASMLYFTFISIPKHLVRFTIRKEWKHLRAYWKAIRWNISDFGNLKPDYKRVTELIPDNPGIYY